MFTLKIAVGVKSDSSPATAYHIRTGSASTGWRRMAAKSRLPQRTFQKSARKGAAADGDGSAVTGGARDAILMRRSFATHVLTDGYDIRTMQELLGRKTSERP